MSRLMFSFLRVGILALAILGTALAQSLTFWSWRPEDKEFYDDIARQFEAQTGIKVVFTAYKNTDYNTALSSALAAGSGPDIIQTRAYGGLAQLADAGYLLPIASQEVKGLDKFPRTLLNAARGYKDKRLFGVPFATQTLGIFYNKALLKKAGVELPQTWGAFLGTLEKLKKAGITPLANGAKDGWTLEIMFGVVGPNFYGSTGFYNEVVGGKRTFNDPVFVRALKEEAQLTPYMPQGFMGVGYDDMRTLFINEQAAFFIGGSFEIGYFRAQNPKLDFGFMAAPPLVQGGRPWVSSFADGNYSINAKTTHKKEALEFLSFLASKEFGQQFTDKLAQISAVPGVTSKDPVLSQVIELTAKYQTPYLMLVGFRYQNPTGSFLLQNGLQSLLDGKATAEQVAADITKGVATWYAPFQGK